MLQGGKYVVRFLPEGKGIDVGYIAHPSYVFYLFIFLHTN
jgi:hypothetical protein